MFLEYFHPRETVRLPKSCTLSWSEDEGLWILSPEGVKVIQVTGVITEENKIGPLELRLVIEDAIHEALADK